MLSYLLISLFFYSILGFQETWPNFNKSNKRKI